MMINMLKSKIHNVRVTSVNVNYEGSIGIDLNFIEKAGLREFEKVDIYNITNGNRFSTYVISESRGSKAISIKGAAARLASPGDRVIIVSYAWINKENADDFKPVLLIMDENNNPTLK